MQHWFNEGHMIWMGLWWLLGIALFVVLLWAVLRAVRPSETEPSPEAILRRRYAAGEIHTEEFDRRMATLRK
jgi:putative membrane protein